MSKGLPLFLVFVTSCAYASNIPGTRMDVDWRKLVSAQDIVMTEPQTMPDHGLLLGNGDIGVSVFGTADYVKLHIGKNDIWDYRDSIDTAGPAITQKELLDAFGRADAPQSERDALMKRSNELWQAYKEPVHTIKSAGLIRFRNSGLANAGYSQRLCLFDAEATGSFGAAKIRTLVPRKRNLIVVNYDPGKSGQFDIELARHKDVTGKIPNGPEFGADGRDIWLRYKLPADPTYPNGFEYVMYGRVIGGEVTSGTNAACGTVKQYDWARNQWMIDGPLFDTVEGQSVAHVTASGPVTLFVAVVTTRDDKDPFARAKKELEDAQKAGVSRLVKRHRSYWHDFWQRSFVQISENPFLTQHWFVSNYHLACCSEPGKVAPGLFGNWCWKDASEWWGDYHWDYNEQQIFYGAYSSNHLEQAVPYNETVWDLLPAAKDEAREIYGLDGAKFFMSTYPRKTTRNPYPVLGLDRAMSVSAWVVQQMWWHYQYSQDKDYLRKMAYPVMLECAKFYEGYLTKAPDGKYDICPTHSPEHWGLNHMFERNKNCTLDLALIRYLMNACIEASKTLGVDSDRRVNWASIAGNLRDYPTADTPNGKVLVDVEGAPYPFINYNCAVPVMAMFPGNDIGLHSPKDVLDMAVRTVKAIKPNLINQYIMLPTAKVRVGIDVLEQFERDTKFLRWPNGALQDDTFPSIYAENFAAPVVMNESVLQSYTGKLHIAPVKLKKTVRFAKLRAEGAFLVSSEIRPDGMVPYVAITSEAGRPCSLVRPWDGRVRVREIESMKDVQTTESGGVISFKTRKGVTYIVDRPDNPWENQPIVEISGEVTGNG